MDPELCLREAKRGFHGGAIMLDFHGTPVELSDATFELADSGEAAPPEYALAVTVARMIRRLSPPEIMRLQQRADNGDGRSELVYHAHVLGKLCFMRRAAARLLARAFEGDEQAKRSIEAIHADAMNPSSPVQRQAEISAYLLRDLMTERRKSELDKKDVVEAPMVDHGAQARAGQVAEPAAAPPGMSGCSQAHPSDIQCAECIGSQGVVA